MSLLILFFILYINKHYKFKALSSHFTMIEE